VSPLFQLDSIIVKRGGRTVLDHLSLQLDPGERLALVGANGAGKSTLLRTLVGLERPVSGTITAFGAVRRREGDFHEVRCRAGLLFQDPDDQLFSPTVIEDVAFGPLNLGLSPAQAGQRAEQTLTDLGLAGLRDRITHHLSGGEKRLVSLAALLAMRPEVLLLDEPNNALDRDHARRLEELLAGLSLTMVIVSHDDGLLARLATRGVVLRDGRLFPASLHHHRHHHDHLHWHELPL